MIDWPFVDIVINGINKNRVTRTAYKFNPCEYEGAVVVPRYAPPHYHHSTFYVKKIRTDLTVDSIDGKSTFRDYVTVIHHLHVTDSTQPILEVVFTEMRLNLLTPRYRNRKGDVFLKKTATNHRVELRVPELCDVHPVPASIWRKAVCLPTIVYRLNQLLVMEELRASIATATGIGVETFRGCWPSVDFQSAVSGSATISFAPAPDKVELATSFVDMATRRRYGCPAVTSAKAADAFDLERLEVLGDSFFKFAVTIDLFCGSTSAQEGLLTQARSRIICNRNLHKLGSKMHVGSMIAQEQFEPLRNWLPPGYWVPEGAENIMMDVDFVFWVIQEDTKILDKLNYEELCSSYERYKTESSKPGFVPPPRNTSGAVPIRQLSQLSDKSVADSVEAIIGAYLLVTGPIGALRHLSELVNKTEMMTSTPSKTKESNALVDSLWQVGGNDVAHIFDVQPSGNYRSGNSDQPGAPAEVESALVGHSSMPQRASAERSCSPPHSRKICRCWHKSDNSIKISGGIPHAGREARSTVQRCTDRVQLRQYQWYCQIRLEQRCRGQQWCRHDSL
ncbi:hypothetical protein MRX96_019205 [Rhipicephalus microplus]